MRRLILLLLALLALLLAAAQVLAHHSFMSEFDINKPVTLKGVITKVEWANPHTMFYVDVADESGAVKNWTLESACPNALMRRGWTRTSLKPGDSVVVEGYLAKNGAPLAATKMMIFPSGLKVMADSDGIRP